MNFENKVQRKSISASTAGNKKCTTGINSVWESKTTEDILSSEDINKRNSVIHFDLPSYSGQDKGRIWKVDSVSFYLVCDGHGHFGKAFAEYAVEYLYENLTTSIDLLADDLTASLNQMFLNLDLLSKTNIPNSLSSGGGTTLSLVISRENDNYIINIGDSEIVLFDKLTNQHQILSQDHSPHNINEFKRIIETNENVVFEYDKRQRMPIVYPIYEKINGEWIKKTPPTRNVYYKNVEGQLATYVGNGQDLRLSVTRAIGDFSFKENYGVIVEPYIEKLPTLTESQSIIIATDGFWDCWKYTEVMEIISNNEETSFEALHKEKADKYFGESKDDTFFIYIPSLV